MVSHHVTGGLAPVAGLAACSFDSVDLSGLQCPCAAGWTCVGELCVEGDAVDFAVDLGTPPDPGPDLGPVESDAGLADGGLSDLGVDAAIDARAPSICESTTAFFCDGFESGLVPPWSSVRRTNEATFAADGMPLIGEFSGHGVTIAPSSRSHVNVDLGGRTGVTVHARAWVYMPSSSPHDVLSFLLIGHDADPDYPLVALQTVPSRSQVYVGVPFRRLATGGTAELFPRDRWVCTTLSIDTGTDTPRLLATVDGTVVADETFAGAVVPAADFGNVGIEFTNAGTPSAELFIDEVEFGIEPLPCD